MGEQDWRQWSLKEKAGQLFIFGFHGYEPDEAVLAHIAEYGLGGVIYFSRNVQSAQQVHALSAALHQAAEQAGRPQLLVSIDQEGGMVSRIVDGVTLMPGNMAIGATGSEQAARETARICGEELLKLGINVNFAPCLDVNNNPDNPVINVRSYSDHPDVVGRLGVAAVQGYTEAGVAATVKHFPGHGDTAVDSHQDMPVIPHDRKRLDAIELVPFKAAIAAGVDVIMTAHIAMPTLEPSGVPATLSPAVLTGLLREELGYDGAIITDCLEMKAIDDGFGPERGAVMALQAGADLVLVCHTYEKQRRAVESVVAAVERGELSEQRLEESLARVMALKAKYGTALAPWDKVVHEIGTPANREAAKRWSEASVTLVKNEGELLPLPSEARTLVLWPEIVAVSEADELLQGDGTLGGYLAQLLPNVVERRMNEGDPLEGLESFERIVLVTYDAVKHELERTIATKVLRRAAGRTVAVSVRNPLDLNVYPEVSAYIAVYECRPLALSSAAKALTGALVPQGRLPLGVSPAYPFGWKQD
ncbi:beta-N-acetylhexosaminidase [Paenibacillus sp. MMS18-CY102]|uniref:beta-N-acetylhexosaminidase n=1 Tax=Paenibacillus sp. MMS18-CY102 TaxID=2682849 RepID=UPI0013665FF0|nr:beta-N-acetylhexosaminidase [Paenibacillus sp. MMS18-CY102]MWC28592.1 beta-N-acetylhexosaminidase [Paenibacillus sp. MMS18-CY102]